MRVIFIDPFSVELNTFNYESVVFSKIELTHLVINCGFAIIMTWLRPATEKGLLLNRSASWNDFKKSKQFHAFSRYYTRENDNLLLNCLKFIRKCVHNFLAMSRLEPRLSMIARELDCYCRTWQTFTNNLEWAKITEAREISEVLSLHQEMIGYKMWQVGKVKEYFHFSRRGQKGIIDLQIHYVSWFFSKYLKTWPSFPSIGCRCNMIQNKVSLKFK